MLRERLRKELLFLDGGMGTLLQEAGLCPGEFPEDWNITHADIVQKIHKDYVQAGSQIILANTFGANKFKYHSMQYSLQEVIEAAIANAKLSGAEYVALDMGPTGKLLKPIGDLDFESTYEAFAETVRIGVKAGADLIHIETMSDTYEIKAAVLAAKENSHLPIFVTVIFDEKGRLLTGGDIKTVVALLEGLRVDAIGMNCGMGPEQMLSLVKEMQMYTSLPMIVKPNAGLPRQKDGKTYFDVTPKQFATKMQEIVANGACVIGGCCGTTPKYIRAIYEACSGHKIQSPTKKSHTFISSYGRTVNIGDKPIIIGERMNPTGKKRLKDALKTQDFDYILREAISQQDAGAHVLDVNVGLPDIDEVDMMARTVFEVQGITDLPLQIDTSDATALEAAMRIYNGKPMVNSVNGKQESMDAVFPLIAKYGGVVVGLTLDERGIPNSAEERIEIAGKLISEATKYGIDKKDIVIDVLTLTISSDANSAKITLDALKGVKERYGVGTVLGVSNISFGLPNRPLINANFYEMAMHNGLSAGIINPCSEVMMQAYDSYCALMNFDDNCQNYIKKYSNVETLQIATTTEMDLKTTIIKGLKAETEVATKKSLQKKMPMDVVHTELIPALDVVGKGYEAGTVFLPQLLMSAEAAQVSFSYLKEVMNSGGDTDSSNQETIMIATVKGDIHDIGKNIVKVLLQNYGFHVIDLGKDVAPEVIVQNVLEKNITLVGLSALMTTTVINMEETIKLLKKKAPWCKVMVGGAVLNQEYADMIRADFYGKDAMQTVHYAKQHFKRIDEGC